VFEIEFFFCPKGIYIIAWGQRSATPGNEEKDLFPERDTYFTIIVL
jgi:hypothetical protein